MAYKDKEKQREAVKAATRRYRANKGDSALSASKQVSQNARGLPVLDEVSDTRPVIPSFPKTTRFPTHKRGKDIKCFADLPVDVQQTIDKMSMVDGRLDGVEKDKRVAAAIKYQHLFPDRYHSTGVVCTGVVTGKPGDADYNGICTKEWRAERGR